VGICALLNYWLFFYGRKENETICDYEHIDYILLIGSIGMDFVFLGCVGRICKQSNLDSVSTLFKEKLSE
jgi:hypothetical protein